MSVERVKYVLGLTFEKNAPFKKLRVQIVSEDTLRRIAEEPRDHLLHFEEPLHNDRWLTLKLMASIYAKEGTNNPNSCLWRMEMAIPRIPGTEDKLGNNLNPSGGTHPPHPFALDEEGGEKETSKQTN